MRETRKTLLLVGEGDTEEAFLRHLRSLYCANRQGVAVTIRNAHGRGPQHIVAYAIRQNAGYDCRAVLMDTDIPWDDRTRKKARENGVTLIGSRPCVEGMLLGILGQPVPNTSDACKLAITKKLPGVALTKAESYRECFARPVLDAARSKIPELDSLLKCLEGS
jgi:hypothetical protein